MLCAQLACVLALLEARAGMTAEQLEKVKVALPQVDDVVVSEAVPAGRVLLLWCLLL